MKTDVFTWTSCIYKDKCNSYPTKCGTCKYNPSKKKDYYEPKNNWYNCAETTIPVKFTYTCTIPR